MTRLSAILVWACSFALLLTSMPATGFAWCLREDGSIRFELTGADGRCIDAEGAIPASGSLPQEFPLLSGVDDCVDLALLGMPVLPQGSQVRETVPSFVAVWPPTVFFACLLPGAPSNHLQTTTLPSDHLRIHHENPFLRDTIVLLL
jgi:hypothetical protein